MGDDPQDYAFGLFVSMDFNFCRGNILGPGLAVGGSSLMVHGSTGRKPALVGKRESNDAAVR